MPSASARHGPARRGTARHPYHTKQAVSELLAYLAGEDIKGADIVKEDLEDLEEAGQSVLEGIDDFLKLAPEEDVLMVEKNTKDQAKARSVEAAAEARAKPKTKEGRELEGTVAGEGSFVAGAWVER